MTHLIWLKAHFFKKVVAPAILSSCLLAGSPYLLAEAFLTVKESETAHYLGSPPLASLPSKGMTQKAVQAQFGTAKKVHKPIGKPAIIRWDYESYSVYFENQHVIHSVNRSPDKGITTDIKSTGKADARKDPTPEGMAIPTKQATEVKVIETKDAKPSPANTKPEIEIDKRGNPMVF